MNSYEVFTQNQPRSFVAESFRILRANLQFMETGEKLQTILLAAGGLGEGTSLITANLGVGFAQTGQRVLIVDCDLRKPQQHLIFNVDNQQGLTSVLSGLKGPEKVIRVLPGSGMMFLPAGPLPANPTELLGGSKMNQLMSILKEKADVILLDAPPLGLVADAAVLSPKVDGVLLVVRSRVASHSSVLKSKELLTNARARTLGVVLNCARMEEVIEKYNSYYSAQTPAPGRAGKKESPDGNTG